MNNSVTALCIAPLPIHIIDGPVVMQLNAPKYAVSMPEIYGRRSNLLSLSKLVGFDSRRVPTQSNRKSRVVSIQHAGWLAYLFVKVKRSSGQKNILSSDEKSSDTQTSNSATHTRYLRRNVKIKEHGKYVLASISVGLGTEDIKIVFLNLCRKSRQRRQP